MTYTNNSDFHIALHENGMNYLIKHSMLYVPSFFNFGSNYISKHPELACNTICADPSVTASGDPLISAINLPISSNLQLPINVQLPNPKFIAQLSELQVDFYPNSITLPETLPTLKSQQLSFHAKTFMGLSCPSEEKIELDCFSLDLFAELALRCPDISQQFLKMHITAQDIVGIKPDGLRVIFDCYSRYLANQALNFVNDQVNSKISKPFESPVKGIVSFKLSPTPIENNPAVEDNQLKLFMDLVSLKLNEAIVIGPSGSSSPGSGFEPSTSKTKRTRPPGKEVSDLTVAISQATFSKIFGEMLNGGVTVDIERSRYGNSPLYIDYLVSASLKNGTISLQNDGKIQIRDLLISWDRLKFEINIDLPEISIPGFKTPAVVIFGQTIIPEIDFPGLELFGKNPDISIPIDLSGDFVSQVSVVLDPKIFYGIGNPSILNCPNRWQFYVAPQLPIFILPIELNERLTSKIKNEIDSFFKIIFFGLPDKTVKMIKDTLSNLLPGPIKLILSDPDKFVESIVDTIVKDNNLGITSKLDKLLYDYFENRAPIFEIQDPFPVSFKNPIGPAMTTNNPIGPDNINIPIPIAYLEVSVNSNEMLLEGDLG